MSKPPQDNQIREEGDLKKFRTETPNLLCSLHLTPFELALYVHLKKTAGAGESGRCFKSTETLSAESEMSVGMVSKAKQGLLRTDRPGLGGKALIRVEKVTGQAGKPRDIITIIDIWRENFRHALADAEPADSGKMPPAAAAQTSPGEHQTSPGEHQTSPGEHQTSPGEHQTSPGEHQTSPGECNKEVLNKEPYEEEREENAPTPVTPAADKLSTSAAASAPVPPSLQDVRCQLREIGQSESHAEKFHAYYDDRGWSSGRDNRPIKDWRKKLALWVIRESEFGTVSAAHKAETQSLTLQDRSQNTLDALNNAGL